MRWPNPLGSFSIRIEGREQGSLKFQNSVTSVAFSSAGSVEKYFAIPASMS